jgi:hypothetical protein
MGRCCAAGPEPGAGIALLNGLVNRTAVDKSRICLACSFNTLIQ